jgi:autotransporter-associated beta strand protein
LASEPANWAEGETPYSIYPEIADVIFPRDAVANKVCVFKEGVATNAHSITFYDDGYTIGGSGSEIDLGHGGITNAAAGGTNTIEDGTIALGIFDPRPLATVFEISSNSNLKITSRIADNPIEHVPGQLWQSGHGTLTLSGKNNYSSHVLATGTLIVGSPTALGVGTLRLADGTLQSSGPISLANSVDVVSTVSTISGSNDITFTGSVQILKGATLTVANTSGLVQFGNTLFGEGGLIKTGAGTLALSGSNTYEGGTDIQAGQLNVVNDNALGQGLLNLSGGRLLNAAPGDITLRNPFQASAGRIETLLGKSLTFTGPGELTGNLDVYGAIGTISPRVTFSGVLSGPGGLTTLAGERILNRFEPNIVTLILSGNAANTYTGTTRVNEGTLLLSKPAGVTAIAGDLVIGDDAGDPGTAVVSLGAAEQIDNLVAVTINSDGLWKMNNFSDGVGSLEGVNPEERVEHGDPPTLTVGFNNRSTTFAGVINGPGTVVKVGTGTWTLNNRSTTFAGVINGPGTVVKVGTGTWTLTGANTYTGGTVVNGGTLLVNGAIVGPVTVNAGATLGGSGTTGPVTLSDGAIISPGGADPGIQRVQDLAFSAESSYVVQLNGLTPGTGYDQLDVTGTVSLNGATLDASLGFSPNPGDAFVIIQNDGTDPVAGTFAGLPEGAGFRIGGVAFHIYYDGGDGNDVALVRNVPPAVTRPGDQTAYQNVDLAIAGLGVGDPDDADITVTLQVSHGTLMVGAVAGLTVVGNGTASVSLSGGQAALNAALAGLLYQAAHNYSGPDVLTVTASDGLDTTSAVVAIRVKSLAEQAADLQAQVNALQAGGVLNQGQANSLVVKLSLKDNNGDIGRVQAFLNEVAALLGAGILSQAQADALLGPGNILLLGLKRR